MSKPQIDPVNFFSIDEIACMIAKDASIVSLTVTLDDQTYFVEGTSKRDPEDEPDDRVGLLLAHGRAFEKLGKALSKRGDAIMRQNEEIRRARPVQAARKKEWFAAQTDKGKRNRFRNAVNDIYFAENDKVSLRFQKLIDEADTTARAKVAEGRDFWTELKGRVADTLTKITNQ